MLGSAVKLSPCQILVERVISKIFSHLKCDVILTDRLRSLFTLKLWRMGKSVSSLGGTARLKIYKKWKTTKWTIQLHQNEIVPISSGNKRKTENENVILQSKRKKICKAEDDLKLANKKLKEVTNQYQALKKSCKTLSAALKEKTDKAIKTSQHRAKNHGNYVQSSTKKLKQKKQYKTLAQHFHLQKMRISSPSKLN